jgi:DNA-binding transcriptional MerR regulator
MTTLVTYTTAARLAGVHKSTLDYWLARGWLRPAGNLRTGRAGRPGRAFNRADVVRVALQRGTVRVDGERLVSAASGEPVEN